MKVNIYDVAKTAGVSVVTVSRVLNNATTVRESSRKKVWDAVEFLNYQPSAAARSLAKGKTNLVGIIVPNLSDSFLSEIVVAVDNELEKCGYSLAVTVLDDVESGFNERRHSFLQQGRVDGVLVLTPLFEEEMIHSLQRQGIPFVMMDNQRYPFVVPSVVVDNYRGGYEATKYLLEAGHERVAHVGGPESFLSAQERLNGFNKALEEVGLEPYGIYRGIFDIENGYMSMQDMFKRDCLPTAIFAGDDHIAFGIIDALREHNLSVPEDISIIGYDDHPFSCKLHPHLTTLRQPSNAIAQEAVSMLLKILKGELKRNAVVKLDPILIARDSVKVI